MKEPKLERAEIIRNNPLAEYCERKLTLPFWEASARKRLADYSTNSAKTDSSKRPARARLATRRPFGF